MSDTIWTPAQPLRADATNEQIDARWQRMFELHAHESEIGGITHLVAREFADACVRAAILGGIPEEARWLVLSTLKEALQGAWDDYVGDTGCFPEAFEISRRRGRGPELTANFEFGGNWLLAVAETLVQELKLESPVKASPTAPLDQHGAGSTGAPPDTFRNTFRNPVAQALWGDKEKGK